jgi:putative peptide zinc metalloprotease protein
MVRAARFLFSDSKSDEGRSRPVAVVAGSLGVLALAIGLLPLPYRTQTEGVVWVPEDSLVRARTDGFIERLVASPGQRIRAGDVLIACGDPDLEAEVKVLAARLRLLDARYQAELVRDQVRAEIVEEERRHARERLARAREQIGDLVIRSAVDGVFVTPHPEDLPGRFLRKGQALAHVLPSQVVTVRAVVSQDDIDLVRERTRRAQVRLAERVEDVVPARVKRVVPGASDQLPSTALGSAGGGQVPIDPRDARGVSAIERLFVVELELEGASRLVNLGGRVHVRFDHGRASMAVQWFRELRQLFLSRLDV